MELMAKIGQEMKTASLKRFRSLPPPLQAWKRTPCVTPSLRRDLASELVVCLWASPGSVEEKTRPDAGLEPEGHVCQATPQSICALRGTRQGSRESPGLHNEAGPLLPKGFALLYRKGLG